MEKKKLKKFFICSKIRKKFKKVESVFNFFKMHEKIIEKNSFFLKIFHKKFPFFSKKVVKSTYHSL